MEINYCMHCMTRMVLDQDVCPACGKDNDHLPVQPLAIAPGTILRGRYLVGAVLGQGGFGITYIGMDLVLLRKVAVKEFFPTGLVTRNPGVSNQIYWSGGNTQITQASGTEGFLKEARKMAELENITSIVQVKDMFLENDTAYIVMEYVEGETLKCKLLREGPMDLDQCIGLLRPMLQDLSRVHSHGLIHRDISPDNIMVRPDGRVCLLDLGAAKDLNQHNAQSSMVVAKTGFSPLEQYSAGSPIGPWTDVYALCATIYYCVTGKCISPSIERIQEDNLDLSAFPQPQRAALEAGLRPLAKDRLQDVQTLLDRLDAPAGKPGKKSREKKPRGKKAKEKKPKRGGFIGLILWLLKAVGIGILAIVILFGILVVIGLFSM